MSTVKAAEAQQAIELSVPAPREFLTTDYVHQENQKLIEEESRRYGLLTWRERRRMQRRVSRLRRALRGYNALVTERAQLAQKVISLKKAYDAETDPRRKQHMALRGQALLERGRAVNARLQKMANDHADYQHFNGWLEYERLNRADLIKRKKDEEQIRKGMRHEVNDIKAMMIREFKRTKDCHHMKIDRKGKSHAVAPKFFRVDIGPDALYLWLLTRKRTVLGYRNMLPYEVDVAALMDEKAILQNMRAVLSRDVTVTWSAQGQLIYRVSRLDSPDALPKLVKWSDCWEFFPEHRRDYLPYTVGVEEHRKFKWFDFGTDPHILVGGTTGSGKSNQINGMIAIWLKTHSPDELRIVLIDQKGGLEFGHWSDVPHLLWNVGKVVDDVIPLLSKVVALMRKRMEILEATRMKKIEAYNRVATKPMARIVVVIDEMANLAELGPITDEIHNLIMIITAMGRAVGVHIICATQQPEVKIVPGRLKVNMRMRISGSMPSTSASMTILDTPDAVSLKPIPGRIMVVSGMQKLIVQAPLINDGDIAHVVSEALREYPEVAEELWEMENVPRPNVWNEARVIKAAMDWNSGGLSGSTLHKLLGDESPGERFLRTLCKRVVDRAQANGGTFQENGTLFTVKRSTKGKGHVISSDSLDSSDGLDTQARSSSVVPTVSEAPTESQPLTESAAD